MQSISSIVRRLRAKTEKMLHLQEALQKSNEKLSKSVEELKKRVEELETDNRKLREVHSAAKIAGKVSGDTEKNLALKLKINELVREIDKCIAQLNR